MAQDSHQWGYSVMCQSFGTMIYVAWLFVERDKDHDDIKRMLKHTLNSMYGCKGHRVDVFKRDK